MLSDKCDSDKKNDRNSGHHDDGGVNSGDSDLHLR